MVAAMAEHTELLRQSGRPEPEPTQADDVVILDPAAG